MSDLSETTGDPALRRARPWCAINAEIGVNVVAGIDLPDMCAPCFAHAPPGELVTQTLCGEISARLGARAAYASIAGAQEVIAF